jgi:hypothetical protein
LPCTGHDRRILRQDHDCTADEHRRLGLEPVGVHLAEVTPIQSRFRDGSQPEFAKSLQIATFLFVAGQDTASKLITSSLRILGECPHLQQQLRAEPQRIPDFIEEVLRTETPARVNFRVARRP